MSASTEEYLEALYNLSQDGRNVTTTDLSKRLNIAPASTTEMLKKLADKGFVNYTPRQGVTLTPSGFEQAEKMTRKHRLLERFLHDVLHLKKDKVHSEACAMEHGLSDETERALCQSLKAPDKCPDDNQVIPACNLGFSNCRDCQQWSGANLDEVGKRKVNVVSITSLKEKQEGIVSFIRGDNKSLRRLLDMGLTPGSKISVNRVAPLKGPVEICVRGSKLAVGDEIACNIFVEKLIDERKD